MYTFVENEKNNASIPATIRLYNSTKFGVDVIGPMNRKYTVKSKSRRCPLQVFFKMLSWDKCMDFIKRHHGRRNLEARIFISLGRRTYHRISKRAIARQRRFSRTNHKCKYRFTWMEKMWDKILQKQ